MKITLGSPGLHQLMWLYPNDSIIEECIIKLQNRILVAPMLVKISLPQHWDILANL
jgi:hypothetical protein